MCLYFAVPQYLYSSVLVHLAMPFRELPYPGPGPKIKPGAAKAARTSITMLMAGSEGFSRSRKEVAGIADVDHQDDS
jgi:hypothetical protein